MATQTVKTLISEVTICNLALGWLGVGEITSLDDDRTEAELCRNNYPMLRDAVLEERMWTFATVRAMSETAERDPWGLMYTHAKPLDWLQVFRCYRQVSYNGSGVDSEGWSVEENNILAPDSTVYLWGVRSVVDTNRFSQLFAQTLAARIAASLAIPITNSRELQVDMWKLYFQFLSDAAARDGQQGGVEMITKSSLISARSGGRGY